MRIVFMGTPEFAVASLRALIESSHVVVGVVTRTDQPAGRGLRLSPPPAKTVATEAHIPVLQPERLKAPDTIEAIRQLSPELIAVAAYGKILPPAVLTLPPRGCLNVHASLLPKYRGAAPIQWALLQGEAVTGITIMQMDEGMDTGDILLQRELPVSPDDTTETLTRRLAPLGAEALLAAIEGLETGRLTPQPQDEKQATYAPAITREHARIDWTGPAEAIGRQVRALHPWPTAYTTTPTGRLLKVYRARAGAGPCRGRPGQVLAITEAGVSVATGNGPIVLEEVQIEGRRRMPASDCARGGRFAVGDVLGDQD